MSAYLYVVNYIEYKVNFRLFDKYVSPTGRGARSAAPAPTADTPSPHALKISFYIILIHRLCHNFVYHYFYTISVCCYETFVYLQRKTVTELKNTFIIFAVDLQYYNIYLISWIRTKPHSQQRNDPL